MVPNEVCTKYFWVINQFVYYLFVYLICFFFQRIYE